MNIDEMARTVSAGTRESVLAEADVEGALATFHATRRRRRRATVAVAGLACAGALAVGASATVLADRAPTGAPAVGGPSNARTPTDLCSDNVAVRCLERGLVVVDGATRYSFRLSSAFVPEPNEDGAPGLMEVYQSTPRTRAGITILQSPGVGSGPDRPTTAREMAHWVAGRPFLRSTPVRETITGGLPAWRVAVRLRGGESWTITESCNQLQPQCRPLLWQGNEDVHWETGPWKGMVSRYTFMDAPGPETLVVWSWAFEGNVDALEVNDRLIRTIDILGE